MGGGGWAVRLPSGGWRRAPGWDSLCPGRGTPEEHTLLKVNSVTKKALRRCLMFLGCGFLFSL
jgi:hypothetical protein